MFGLFRLYLALAVVAHHVLRIPTIGNAAVFAFFTLSGFLMTNILARTYGYSPNGVVAYLVNRSLRLLPSYWVAIGLSLLFIVIVGEPFAHSFNRAFGIPDSAASWAMNGTMIFPALRPADIEPRLFPIVWTLTIELFYYVLMGLGATRTKLTSMAMFALGAAYHLYGVATGQPFEFHYSTLPAGALPFAAGALTYHYRDALVRMLGRKPTVMLLAHMAVLAAAAFAYAVDVHLFHHGLEGRASLGIDLANLVAAIAISVLTIGALYRPAHYLLSEKLDTALGKYSYPFYLLHLQTAMVVSGLLFGHKASGMNLRGIICFGLTLAITLLVSWVLIRFIEPNVDRIRDRVKLGRRVAKDAPDGPQSAHRPAPLEAS